MIADSNESMKAQAILANGLAFLRDFGYSGPVAASQWLESLGNYLEVEFHANQIDRGITANYLAPTHNRIGVLSIFLTCEAERFSVDEWSKFHGRHFESRIRSGNDVAGEITQICHSFRILCENELRPIIDGTTWEDVPIDWAGHK